MWFTFAVISALLYAFRGVLEKRIIGRTNKYVLGLAIRLFALPFFFIPFIFNPGLIVPLQDLSSNFWVPAIIICCICTPLETVFYYEALKEEELSMALPILSIIPVITLVIAAIFLHEYPSVLGILGILLILFGVYALKISHAKEGLLEPLKHLAKSRGVRLMFVVMLSAALGGVLDKMATQASNAFFYGAVNYLMICMVLFLIAFVKARKELVQLRTHFASFLVIGLFVAGYTIFYLLALQTGVTSYVVAIRNSSILFSIIFGVVLLREKGARAKLLAGALIFLGLVCIKVLG
jgi:uncharacterized membrane protein